MLELIRAVPPAGTAHTVTLTAAVRARLAGDLLRSEKQLTENIWIVLFKYLECPDTAAAIQRWQGTACL